jgi:hypothetical protein
MRSEPLERADHRQGLQHPARLQRAPNAKTLITTPNSDVIYALGYLDLKEDGPMVIEVPPGLQGILDDFFQRPICSAAPIGGRTWCGDVGLPGPDKGKGGYRLRSRERLGPGQWAAVSVDQYDG